MNMYNVESVKSLAHKNPTAETIFTALALRERQRAETDLYRFQNLLTKQGNIDPKVYMETFKEMESLGLGSIIYGRRGKPTRFKWSYDLKKVGKDAVGDASKAARKPRKRRAKSAPVAQVSPERKSYSVIIRKGEHTVEVVVTDPDMIATLVKGLA